MSKKQNIFITHDPKWRDVDDISEFFSQVSNKNIWYRKGRWSCKLLQNISNTVGKNIKFLSLGSEEGVNINKDLFQTKGRTMDLIVVFYDTSENKGGRPSWCQGVIKNSISMGYPLLTRSKLEKGWVFSWGEEDDEDGRKEKIFPTIEEFGSFIQKWDDQRLIKNRDWIESFIGMKLCDDDDDQDVKLIRELTDAEYKEKMERVKEKISRAKEEAEASRASSQFYDPTFNKLRRHEYKKKMNKKLDEECKKEEEEREKESVEDDKTPNEISEKTTKYVTRKIGKMKVKVAVRRN